MDGGGDLYLDLYNAVYMAQNNNPQVQIATLDAEEARQNLAGAKDAVKTLEENRQYLSDMAKAASGNDNKVTYTFGFDNEVTAATAVSRAELGVKLADYGLTAKKLAVRAAAEQAYYQVVLAQENLDNAKAAADRTGELYDQAQKS